MADATLKQGCSEEQIQRNTSLKDSAEGDSAAISKLTNAANLFYKGATIKNIVDERDVRRIVSNIQGGLENIQEIYPLAPLQEGILFHYLMNEETDTYVLSTSFKMASLAQVDELVGAINKVIHRHDILRTAMLWEGLPRPMQVVQRDVKLHVAEITLSSTIPIQEQIDSLMRPWGQRLDLRKAPMMRLIVATVPEGDVCYSILHVHHIACDHHSLQLLVEEVVAHLDGREQTLPRPVPFRDYVVQALEECDIREAEEFFKAKLADVEEPTAPFGLLDVYGDGSCLEESHQVLGFALAEKVRDLARSHGVSVARLFHAAWGLVVAVTSGKDEAIFGTVILSAKLRKAGAQRMLGLTVNTLPLRLSMGNVTVKGLLEQTSGNLLDLSSWDAAPLPLAQKCSGIIGAAPLFTSTLNYRRSENSEGAVAHSGIRVDARGEAWTNYPISLTVDDWSHGLTLIAKADRRVGSQRIIGYLTNALQSLAYALEHTPHAPAMSLSILSLPQRSQLLETFNAGRTICADGRLVHGLFEEQVERRPNEIAIVYDEKELTYAEADRRANLLAMRLRRSGVRPDDIVAVCVERSLDMIVALLGVMKAGGAYLPIDPSYPVERRAQILSDAQPKITLMHHQLRENLGSTTGKVIEIDEDWERFAYAETSGAADVSGEVGACARRLAYVIYTSGSTGRPKGVMIEHRSVVSLWLALEHIYDECIDCQRVAVNASFCFDASVKQIIQLLSGRTLVLIPEDHRLDVVRLTRYLRDHRVNAIDCTPSQAKVWLSSGLIQHMPAHTLRLVLVGGEPVEMDLWMAMARVGDPKFYNLYGPTESTVDTTFARVGQDVKAPHIGRPMDYRRVYVLNGYAQPVPAGVTGEIYIGGSGLARGYLNRPELTALAFVPDPFSDELGACMYRTGDFGRWCSDGTLEFVGRNDYQVKIRGFRIELGEIESALIRHEVVRNAVVVELGEAAGELRLAAYVVPNDPTVLGSVTVADKLLHYLRSVLPEYMVPNTLVMLERLPLTPNGKLDRQALRTATVGAKEAKPYEAPQGECEEILARIWQQLLPIDRVGRSDNFFELGGHSLLVMRMLDGLRRAGLAAMVRSVFETPRLSDLARTLSPVTFNQSEMLPNRIPSACNAITPHMLTLIELDSVQIQRVVESVPGGAENVKDIYPLAPLQEGILFHHLMSAQRGDVYVVPTLLSLSSRDRLEDLIGALEAVIDRHDVLRTSVLWEHLPRPVQVVHRHAGLPVHEVALSPERPYSEQLKEWMKPERQRMDLRKAPLVRLQVAEGEDGQWFALLQMHHIVEDVTSQDMVISEIVDHLQGKPQAKTRTVPYRNHVAQTLRYARIDDAEVYFRRKFGDVVEPTAPFEILDVHGDGTNIRQVREALEHSLSLQIRIQAKRLGVSAATLFHAAWALVVAATSGRDDVVFGSVLLGRMQGTTAPDQVLGLFINTLPLRFRLRDVTARGLVEQTQRELVELLEHEQDSLSVAQRCSGIGGSRPLFTALLNYRHRPRTPDAEWIKAEGVQLVARHGFTNYPLTLSVDDLSDGGFALTTQTDLRIDPCRVTQLLERAFRLLLEDLENNKQTAVLAIPIVPEVELHRVIREFNETTTVYEKERLVHQLFEDQVERRPGETALVDQERNLTYAELNAKANQLAHFLRERGVRQDHLVGICLERGSRMIIALLATLKAGAAYVPLDPSYPASRLAMMLEDAAPRVLIAQKCTRAALPKFLGETIELDEKLAEIVGYSEKNLSPSELTLSSMGLVYVIYTSGSTGRPKGVAMTHRSMSNLLEWHRQSLALSKGERVLQFAALSFDVAFQEIFSTLCGGGTLVTMNEWVRRDSRALAEFLASQEIARVFIPPIMLQGLAEWARGEAVIQLVIKDVICAGEQLRISDEVSDLFKRLNGCKLHNHYGPTETHVVTALTLPQDCSAWPPLPSIGRPIANTQVYVVNSVGCPVPIGVVGGIYIGGEQVALGYLNRSGLTSQRFSASNISDRSGARLYRTGDLGRWRSDGTLEYLGREDEQVKIRGFRIELGEIEASLLSHESVRQAVVILREDRKGEKRLVAYLTRRSKVALNSEELREHLKRSLPEYMVPSAIVVLEELPTTPSGKLDRRSLPVPDSGAFGAQSYDAPQGAIEELIANIWQEALGMERVGRHDNFFDLGGHSLLATRVVSKINHLLEVNLQLRALFDKPTVEGLKGVVLETIGAELSVEAR